MNNLKKIGLTALAGCLAVTSVQATELTASGSASIGFGGADKGTSGNGFYMNDEVTFSGSGELDNGWNVTLSMQLDANEKLDHLITWTTEVLLSIWVMLELLLSVDMVLIQ